jgi:hypothetical protein
MKKMALLVLITAVALSAQAGLPAPADLRGDPNRDSIPGFGQRHSKRDLPLSR